MKSSLIPGTVCHYILVSPEGQIIDRVSISVDDEPHPAESIINRWRHHTTNGYEIFVKVKGASFKRRVSAMSQGLGADYFFELEPLHNGIQYFVSGTAYLEQDGSGGCWVASPENIRIKFIEPEPSSVALLPRIKEHIQSHLNTRDLTEWFQENVLAQR